MKRYLLIGALATALGLGAVATLAPLQSAAQSAAAQSAAQLRTATFAVDHMTCASCPITVRTAMARVAGVRSVDVDFATKRATVTFDPAVAAPEAIAAASTNAGYPARAIASASQ